MAKGLQAHALDAVARGGVYEMIQGGVVCVRPKLDLRVGKPITYRLRTYDTVSPTSQAIYAGTPSVYQRSCAGPEDAYDGPSCKAWARTMPWRLILTPPSTWFCR